MFGQVLKKGKLCILPETVKIFFLTQTEIESQIFVKFTRSEKINKYLDSFFLCLIFRVTFVTG